jgi:hypothetical protein
VIYGGRIALIFSGMILAACEGEPSTKKKERAVAVLPRCFPELERIGLKYYQPRDKYASPDVERFAKALARTRAGVDSVRDAK